MARVPPSKRASARAFADECSRLLAADGPFASLVPGFRSRPQQETMTRRVAYAIENGGNLVIEAGTGVGKTFAYLVPAVLSGKKVVISTGTRYLQDQIYTKDLPLVLKALGIAADTALLKGRANYLCAERLEQAWRTRALDADDNGMVERVYRWSKTAAGGDISDFGGLSENDPLWASLTSTSENCLGARCPKFDECCVAAARNRALQADLVVVNHYLLLADMTLREEGFGQLLPQVDTVIIDEAHQLGGIANHFFSISFTSSQCLWLLRDIRAAGDAAKTPELMSAAVELESAIATMMSALGQLPVRETTAVALGQDDVAAARRVLAAALEQLAGALQPLRRQSEQLFNLWDRAEDMRRRFAEVLESGGDRVGWYQTGRNSFRLYASPTDVAPLLSDKHKLYDANWIYTSATLSLGGDFTYFLAQTGLAESCARVALDSPFDYAEQAALYVPSNLPDPNDPEHTAGVIETGYRLLEMAQGGVFFLFTSHRALQAASRKIADETDYTLLVQGSAPKVELIRRFCSTSNAVLLGTAGFWEGVDVRGAGLRCVIIDRLPFASPSDPLTRGRIHKAKEQGRDFFREATLPEAVISLRQGIGRLIRDETDIGVVMIGDKRLRTRSYGKLILNSLPPMKRCEQLHSLRPYLSGANFRPEVRQKQAGGVAADHSAPEGDPAGCGPAGGGKHTRQRGRAPEDDGPASRFRLESADSGDSGAAR